MVKIKMRIEYSLNIKTKSDAKEIVKTLFYNAKKFWEYEIQFPVWNYIRTTYDPEMWYFSYLELPKTTYFMKNYTKEFIIEQITLQYNLK